MEFHVVPFDRLTPQELTAWSQLQGSMSEYASPYYCPEFAQAVHAVRCDVEVAVLAQGGNPRGFFAFHRRRRTGYSVGSPMADYQGPVVASGQEWDATELVRACGLATWTFDHVPVSLGGLAGHAWRTAPSPYLDLSAGFEAFVQQQHVTSGSEEIHKTIKKAKKLGVNVGPLRLVSHTTDSAILATLLDWKRAQYQKTGVPDDLATPWKRALLEQIISIQNATFAGMLSALYAGDQLVAIHLGMRSKHVLHGWFPAYNQALSRYSPGLILWIEIARAAADLGIRQIDLGKGPESYKRQIMSGATLLGEGRVDVQPVTRWVHGTWQWMRVQVEASPLRESARAAKRLILPWIAKKAESS